ncbi:MAG: papain-like cysteine protease family protein [Anaerolineales bacterium]|nr:papain-like cysteine protease family protein [Anaerolineales bacterium]
MKATARVFQGTVLTIIALALFAGSAQADCGEGEPDCPLIPPQSRQVAVSTTSGRQVIRTDSYSLPIQPAPLSMPLPARLEPTGRKPEDNSDTHPDLKTIEVSLRRQDPSDVSCGVQALGMALEPLEGAAPSSAAILDFLLANDYLYDFGTGAEELAMAAQSLGYAGSVAFHGWTLEDLHAEFEAGRPVVVDLGANGPDQPGHFVTLTGIAADWSRVAYSDPILDERVVPLAEFMRLWDLQGNSGVAVAAAPPAAGSPDYAPWTALAAAMMATLALGPGVLEDLRRKGAGGSIRISMTAGDPVIPDQGPSEPPPPKNPVRVTTPYVENIVIGEKVIGGHWEDREKYVEPRWETVSPGHWEWQERLVPYTAYRPKSILIEKVVNVVREVTEKVTTWVEKTVAKPVTQWVKKSVWKPVTKWVRRTKTWFQRTWLGRWIRKTRSWVEKKVSWVKKTVWKPVKKWVTKKVVEPVTRFVKRRIVEPVTRLVRETIMEPYTAYRTEKVEVWTDPVKRYIPGHYVPKKVWVEEKIPITQQVTRWDEVYVDAGDLPAWVADEFFQMVDPALSYKEQLALFEQFKDALGQFQARDPQSQANLYQLALDLYFNGFSPESNGIEVAQSLPHSFGAGQTAWNVFWDGIPTAAQYLFLDSILGEDYPFVHNNLCGELAAIATMGLDIVEGIRLFEQLQTSRPVLDENGRMMKDEQGNWMYEPVAGAQILGDSGEGTDGWQLQAFLRMGGASEASYKYGSYNKPPYTVEELAKVVEQVTPPLALVNIDLAEDGHLSDRDTPGSHRAHWVTILAVMPTHNGAPVVRVYNPYQNREELYSWDAFQTSWADTGNNHSYGIVASDEE